VPSLSRTVLSRKKIPYFEGSHTALLRKKHRTLKERIPYFEGNPQADFALPKRISALPLGLTLGF
jgi:hypothetical protein